MLHIHHTMTTTDDTIHETVATSETRNVFKKKTGRRIMDGEFHYRLIEISYNSERPNDILSNKVNE